MPSVRFVSVAVVALLLCLAGIGAQAQGGYPNRPVKVLTGFPPGQASDTLGRYVVHKLQESLGQPFQIDNRPGAAATIATQAAAGAPADGYTLLLTTSGPMAVNPALYTKLPYDPVKDFAPVAGIATVPLLLVVNPSFPATSLKEFVAVARARPDTIDYASSGIGVTNHLVTEMFSSAAGIHLNHIPYKGGPPGVADLVGGQVSVMFETTVAVLPLVRQGKLRALATSSSHRIAAAPDVPTVAELGYPGFNGVPWAAIMAPARTPPAIVAKLNAEINRILRSKETREYFTAQGVEPMPMTPDELGRFVNAEIAKWTKAVKDSGAKAE